MEVPSNDNSVDSSNDREHHQENTPPIINHCSPDLKPEGTEEDIKGILQVIASTGKFWHDWEKLKGMLSFHLKQVLSEYPEASKTAEEQHASLGETYSDLVHRLNEALLRFYEGPPFTLQRLCEILMAARSIYPNLPKLSLALEKNLLVTSTLRICTDPYPPTIAQTPVENNKASKEDEQHSNSEANGVEPMADDKDEIMTEAEAEAELEAEVEVAEVEPQEADIVDAMTIDKEAGDTAVELPESDAMLSENC